MTSIPSFPLRPPAGAWRPRSEYFMHVLGSGDHSSTPQHVKHFLKRQAEASVRRAKHNPSLEAPKTHALGRHPNAHLYADGADEDGGSAKGHPGGARQLPLSYDAVMEKTPESDPTMVHEIDLRGAGLTTTDDDLRRLYVGPPSAPSADPKTGDGGEHDDPWSWAHAFLSLQTLDVGENPALRLDHLLSMPLPSVRVLTAACNAAGSASGGSPISLTAPPPMGATLMALDVSFNALAGNDLITLGAALPRLRVLNLAGNGLRVLPADLAAAFPSLQVLSLEANELFEADDVDALGQIASLVELNLARNSLTRFECRRGPAGGAEAAAGPAARFPKLKTLDLSRNLIMDTAALAGCRDARLLERIVLDGNPFITSRRDRGVPGLALSVPAAATVSLEGADAPLPKRRGGRAGPKGALVPSGIAATVFTVPKTPAAADREIADGGGAEFSRGDADDDDDDDDGRAGEDGDDGVGGFFLTQGRDDEAVPIEPAATAGGGAARRGLTWEERIHNAFFHDGDDEVGKGGTLSTERDMRRLYRRLRDAIEAPLRVPTGGEPLFARKKDMAAHRERREASARGPAGKRAARHAARAADLEAQALAEAGLAAGSSVPRKGARRAGKRVGVVGGGSSPGVAPGGSSGVGVGDGDGSGAAGAARGSTESYLNQLESVISSMRLHLSSVETPLATHAPLVAEVRARYEELHRDFASATPTSDRSSPPPPSDRPLTPGIMAEIEALRRELDAEEEDEQDVEG